MSLPELEVFVAVCVCAWFIMQARTYNEINLVGSPLYPHFGTK